MTKELLREYREDLLELIEHTQGLADAMRSVLGSINERIAMRDAVEELVTPETPSEFH